MVEIRDAQPGDAHGIAAVAVESWQVTYKGLLPESVLTNLSVPDQERTWCQILIDPPPRTAVLLATSEAIVVGFVAVGPGKEATAGSEMGELYAIYLRPDQWGRGIGAQLHSAAMDRLSALGFTKTTLWVLEGNERAIVSIIGTDGRPMVRGGSTRDQAVSSSPNCVCAARCLRSNLAWLSGRRNARFIPHRVSAHRKMQNVVIYLRPTRVNQSSCLPVRPDGKFGALRARRDRLGAAGRHRCRSSKFPDRDCRVAARGQPVSTRC